jgi:hypothetical protein
LRQPTPLSPGVFFDENGKFIPTFGGAPHLLVPPRVHVTWLPSSDAGHAETPALVYPLPDQWQPERLPPGRRFTLREDNLYFPGNPEITGGWRSDRWGPVFEDMGFAALQEIGWQAPSSTAGLLGDFLRLARDASSRKALEQVQAFAMKWGPLWMCRAHSSYCHVGKSTPPIMLDGRTDPCGWAAVEEVQEFLKKAREAKAVVEVAERLQQGRAIPASFWKHIPYTGGIPHEDPELCLTAVINIYLYLNGGQRLWFAWTSESPPRLWVQNSLGFIRAVWLEIAQSLSNAHGLLQCDGCGDIYVRAQRRPRPGQRNFCPACGAKASKRLSAQRTRQKPPP